jgi:FecR-like protein
MSGHMANDYLWDPHAPPDPDVRRLEAALGRLRTPLPPLRLPESAASSSSNPAAWSMRFLAPTLAAAAAMMLMIGATWRTTHNGASWEVARIDGRPTIESTPVDANGRIAVGQTLVTDSTSRARIDVSTIGQVTIDHDSRVRLVATRDGHHRLALDRGTLRASIVAPPGQFIVDTPSARATDLGCAYTLHVDEEGGGTISVTAGWVAFELDGRESFVPAGASCRTDRARGLGTPRYDNESQAYRDALDDFDFGDPSRRREPLHRVLELGGHGDAVTLWHLIPRVDASDRAAVVDALADQVAMPDGVTRDAVVRLDKTALDRWWDTLGLGDTTWWRMWKKPVPGQ